MTLLYLDSSAWLKRYFNELDRTVAARILWGHGVQVLEGVGGSWSALEGCAVLSTGERQNMAGAL